MIDRRWAGFVVAILALIWIGGVSLAQCSGSLGDNGRPMRQDYVRRLTQNEDVSRLVDPKCSASDYRDLVTNWNSNIKSVFRDNDWSKFSLVDATSGDRRQTLYLTQSNNGICLFQSAFGRAMPEHFPGAKCSRCTIEVWPREVLNN